MPPQLIALLALMAVSFSGGWMVNGWRRDSIEAVTQQAAMKAAAQFQSREQAIAKAVEEKLAALPERERIVERGIIREIQKNETVYRNVCITDAGRLLINSLAEGTDTGKPDAAVPGAAAGAAR